MPFWSGDRANKRLSAGNVTWASGLEPN